MSILQKSLSGIKYVLPYGFVMLLKAARAECKEFLLKSRGNWFIPQGKFDECIVIAYGPSLKNVGMRSYSLPQEGAWCTGSRAIVLEEDDE